MSLICMEKPQPELPPKRYFTIGEVSDLCGVKPYVLRYWEQEFTQLKPMKRRGNRRYYQHHEVQLIRRIRGLLYDEGFTISGARNRLGEGPIEVPADSAQEADDKAAADATEMLERIATSVVLDVPAAPQPRTLPTLPELRHELMSIRSLLQP